MSRSELPKHAQSSTDGYHDTNDACDVLDRGRLQLALLPVSGSVAGFYSLVDMHRSPTGRGSLILTSLFATWPSLTPICMCLGLQEFSHAS